MLKRNKNISHLQRPHLNDRTTSESLKEKKAPVPITERTRARSYLLELFIFFFCFWKFPAIIKFECFHGDFHHYLYSRRGKLSHIIQIRIKRYKRSLFQRSFCYDEFLDGVTRSLVSSVELEANEMGTATRDSERSLTQPPSGTQVSRDNQSSKLENVAENKSEVRLDPKETIGDIRLDVMIERKRKDRNVRTTPDHVHLINFV